MNSPAPTIFEVCNLISAQIDALDNPEPLTPEQLLGYMGRSEKIKVLCEQLEPHRTELEEQLLDTVELLESVA